MTEIDLIQKKIKAILQSNGLTVNTKLYRYTLPQFIEEKEAGEFFLSANDDPSEAVIDVYEGGHTSLALHVGPGLAFSRTKENEWESRDRTAVVLRLQDVLEQGGRIYPVESIITEQVWYFTLPDGHVRVNSVNS
jgi:hypothetical protein